MVLSPYSWLESGSDLLVGNLCDFSPGTQDFSHTPQTCMLG